MRSLLRLTLVCLTAGLLFSCNTAPKKLTREDLGWKLGTQAYTFRNFTFFEAVEKTKALGLHYIEAYPGQKIGGGMDGVMNYDMDSTSRQKIKDYLQKEGVELIAFGVIVPRTTGQWDSLFAFAQEMGVSNIVSEPLPEQLPYVSKLCDQYQINVAIHNHPKPSHYWSPDTLLAATSGLSTRIGSCADLGHFIRSGLDPLESLRKLEGHLIEFHFKDVSVNGPEAEDTIWGTGICDLPAIISEIQRQHFKGYFSIEYESDPADNMNQIQKSIQYFDQQIGQLKETATD